MLLKLAGRSLLSRRATAVLTVVSLSIGVALLVGLDQLRHQAKSSFQQTLSGTDLIAGPPGGQTNLLLQSVFQMGRASGSLSAEGFETLAGHPMVEWAVPVALGDTVRGFPLFATHRAYFERYRYGQRQSLVLAQGRRFDAHSDDEVVLGARAARKLELGPGDSLVVSHGGGDVSFTQHEGHPLTVVGLLEPTGTAVDRRVHTSLLAMDRLHREPDHAVDHDQEAGHPAGPESGIEPVPGPVNAVFLGLKNRPAVFALQRELSQNRTEPMTAVMPGVALTELWQRLAVVENFLLLMTSLVLLATLIGMMTMLLASLGERRRELAILRAVGAGGGTLFWLIELEALLLAGLGLAFGLVLASLALALAKPWLATELGLFVAIQPIGAQTLYLIPGILGLALLAGLVPGVAAYRRALAEGLNPGY